ncbi:hypothetical protein [Mycobacterium sp. 1164966.3]|uniref:hypothetical protein n=1 Tax=Mycobacterium sp. 1164966.3 TaxID=1856861 RepID=UPI0012E85686|nr:hypothetical protein [Mycobacterium sp. 1164966.3]
MSERYRTRLAQVGEQTQNHPENRRFSGLLRLLADRIYPEFTAKSQDRKGLVTGSPGHH